MATLALWVRGPEELHNSTCETAFAEFLNRIGFSSDAEKVLRGLPPIERTVFDEYGSSRDSEEFVRRDALEASLVAQRKYQQVVSLPSRTGTQRPSIYHGMALFGLHRDKEALQILKRESACPESILEFGLLIELCKLTEMTEMKKQALKDMAAQFRQAKLIDDFESVTLLQLAADRLQYIGLVEEANKMKATIKLINAR